MAAKTEKASPVEPVEKVIDRSEEYVDFMIPLTSPDDRPVFIGVNGDAIRVKPGEVVSVKRKFVEVYNNSIKQRRDAMNAQRNAQNASKKALADL